MIRILFVCTGNTCRSPMAEDAARRLLSDLDDVEFVSAGVAAASGQPASNHARFVAAQAGGDLESHRSRALDEIDPASVDLVVAMTRRHAESARTAFDLDRTPVLTLAEAAGGDPTEDVDDPFGGSLEDYERTAAQIEAHVRRLRARIEGMRASS